MEYKGIDTLMAKRHQASEHLDEDKLELYALGRLPAGLSARMGKHLHECASCGRRLSRTREFLAAIIGALSAAEPHEHAGVMRVKTDS